MSSDDSGSQDTLISTFYVSTVDVILAKGSRKTVRSIKLRKNDDWLRDVTNPKCVDGMHRLQFIPPVALDPDDHISVSVNCGTLWMRTANIPIDIRLRDIECIRGEKGIVYQKKVENGNVEIAIAGHESLLATTNLINKSCDKFRLLVVGNSGVGKSSLLQRLFGVENVHISAGIRGIANIDQEFTSPVNDRFIVHDSLGLEAGDEQNMNIVRDFVSKRKTMSQPKDQLHAIWLCLEIPYCGGRLLEGGTEKLLQCRNEIMGNIPLVVVLTKLDLLDTQVELDLPMNETFEHCKARYLNEHCISPLCRIAGRDITYVTVSVQEDYSETLSSLFKATNENVANYHGCRSWEHSS